MQQARHTIMETAKEIGRMFRTLDDSISVAPQIEVADVAAAKAQGFVALINNRPDGEAPDQPSGAEIAAAAAAAGLSYIAIPVDHSGMRPEQVATMRAALEAAGGPVLAYCRSGTRSTYLWALARAQAGEPGPALAAKAAAAGYDLTPLRGVIG